MDGPLKIFAGNANPELSVQVAKAISLDLGQDIELADCEATRFSDGEVRIQIGENVRGADAFILQPTCPPANDNLMELLVMIDALKRASAQRIVPVVPYYGYSRQDKKDRPREPITAKLVADLLTTAGADRIFSIDLHAQQIQGFFDTPVDHLPAGPILADYMVAKGFTNEETVVVSPDVGGVERASIFARRLNATLAIIAKRRPTPNESEVVEVIGDVDGKQAILVDDMIDTAGSITAGTQALIDRGAKEVYACCTHALLSGPAVNRLANSPITEVVVTDTIPLKPEMQLDKFTVLSVAPLLARVIAHIHENKSISSIFDVVLR